MSEKKTKVVAESGKQDLWITREFDAPLRLVFKAHADPALFAQWYGCGGVRMDLKQFEAKTGGSYQYIQNMGGKDFSLFGSYHLVREDKIVRTSEFSGYPDRCLLDVTTFEKIDESHTLLRCHMIFQSLEDRDAMVKAGVEFGSVKSHEILDQILKEKL